jgi:DNA-binding transcriptional LysR family regulator
MPPRPAEKFPLMTTDALRVFREVALLRSFSQAAKKLDMTQSAASQAVQHLERSLDQQLFDRGRRPPRLTPAGERFLAAAEAMLDELERARADLEGMRHEVAGPLAVASIYSVALYHSAALDEFRRKFPRVRLEVQYMRPHHVETSVHRGDAALGLLSYPHASKDLGVIPWRQEEMALVTPPGHPLAANPTLRPAELRGQALVGFDSDLEIRRATDAFLAAQAVEIRVQTQFDNIETVKRAIEEGAGVGILPLDTVKKELALGTVRAVRFAPETLFRQVGILYRKGRPWTPAAQRFVEVLTGQPFRPPVAPTRAAS